MLPDVWTEERVVMSLKSLESIATSLKAIRDTLEGDPKNKVLPRIASALETTAKVAVRHP